MSKSFCKSASIYVIARVGLGAGVHLGAKVSFGFRPRKLRSKEPNSGKPGVTEPGPLLGPLPFAMVLFPCAIALLGVESSSNSLGAVKLCKGFFWQVTILKQSGVKRWKFWAFPNKLALPLDIELLKL